MALRVCIVGAGAVGGLFGAWLGSRLPAGDVQLSVLARGATLDALRRDGLRWTSATTPDAPEQAVAVTADDRPETLGTQDLVIVAVKGPALAAVAPAVRALCGPGTDVLVAMNGVPWWFFDGLPGAGAGLRLASVDPADAIRLQIDTARVIGCVVHFSASAPAPGRVRHGNGQGLIVGEPAGGRSPRVERLAAMLGAAGFGVTVSEQIQRDIWFKLWGNMTMNPVSALTGATADRVLDDPLVRGFITAAMLEAQAIGARIGLPIDQTPEQRHAVTRKLGAFKTSMLQDVEARRPLELDALVGAVREIGAHVAVPTPTLDGLFGLTRLMARSHGLYPDASA